ncbi:MAG: YciI family protein [Bryobacteraceae bacterium]
MKYMLMMAHRKTGGDPIGTWPPQDIKAHIAFMIGMNQELSANGELVSAQGLAGPEEAKVIRAAKDGSPITDGVFPESKEFLAGYWVLDVESPERVYAIAARISAAPGRNGLPLNMPIEVRQIMAGPPPDML